MQMLYDSDNFVVVHIPMLVDPDPANGYGAIEPSQANGLHGFEVVDKRTNKEAFLTGRLAQAFQQQINEWQRNTPPQEAVEEALDRWAAIANLPLVMH